MQSKSILVIIILGIATLLQGCAVVPARVHAHGDVGVVSNPNHGYRSYGYYDGAARTTPCEPYQADRLMEWAKGLDSNPHHSRSADVRVRNDRADCSQSERAGSQMGQQTKRRN